MMRVADQVSVASERVRFGERHTASLGTQLAFQAVAYFGFVFPFWRAPVRHMLQGIPVVILLLIATVLEVSGDAVVRLAIYNHAGQVRLALFVAGAALLLGYGTFLNLAPFEFGQVVGLYLATLLIVWQVINYLAFRAIPTVPIMVGGSLVIAGGAIITLWKPG